MHFRKCSGYAVYPLLAVFLFASFAARAQDASPQQTSTQASQEQQQTTPEQRSEILRQAQQRVNARRKLRVKQIIQDTYSHKYEFNFGSGYLRFIPGPTLQRMNEVNWNVDITDYIHGDLGVTGQVHGFYGTTYTGRNPYSVFKPSISQYSFMAGPRYRFFKGQHWGWTGQVLAGAEHGNFGTGTHGLPPELIGLFKDSTVLSLDAGASVDYNLGPALAIRLTPHALFTNYGSDFQRNLGWDLGIVYRFGRK